MLNENRRAKPHPSWTAVVIALILFWPVGLILLYIRMSSDKTALSKNSKIFRVVGWILLVLGILEILMAPELARTSEHDISAGGMIVIFLIFFVLVGLVLIFKAKKMKKIALRYNQYSDVIFKQRAFSIDYIASALFVSYEFAVKDLRDMIDWGLLENAYMDERERLIRLSIPEPAYAAPSREYSTATSAPKTVICKNCGASNAVIPGGESLCEYCGSHLST